MFACGGMHVTRPISRNVSRCARRRSPLLSPGGDLGRADLTAIGVLRDHPSRQLSGPILVTTVVGLAIFLVAVLLSPETKGKVLVADLTVA